MIRHALLCGLTGLTIVALGCAKSGESQQKADTAVNGLMPVEEPGFEAAYVIDQKQVKLATAPEISYEPLDSFRAANTSTGAKAKKRTTTAEAGAAEVASGEKGKGKKGGLFGRMKAKALGKTAGLIPGAGTAGAAPEGEPPDAAAAQGEEAEAEPAGEPEEEEEVAEEPKAAEPKDTPPAKGPKGKPGKMPPKKEPKPEDEGGDEG